MTTPVSEPPVADAPASDAAKDAPKKPNPCCACPETKKPRDECILMLGESDPKCQELIEAHRACMRQYGYNV